MTSSSSSTAISATTPGEFRCSLATGYQLQRVAAKERL
jgi:hypothetical protein